MQGFGKMWDVTFITSIIIPFLWMTICIYWCHTYRTTRGPLGTRRWENAISFATYTLRSLVTWCRDQRSRHHRFGDHRIRVWHGRHDHFARAFRHLLLARASLCVAIWYNKSETCEITALLNLRGFRKKGRSRWDRGRSPLGHGARQHIDNIVTSFRDSARTWSPSSFLGFCLFLIVYSIN